MNSTDDDGTLEFEDGIDQQHDGIVMDQTEIPRWLGWISMLIIVCSIPYFAYFHGGADGRSLGDLHDARLADLMRARFAEIGELSLDGETVNEYRFKDSWLQVGRVVFKKNCASCHGKDGGGLIGPNLCDDNYKHVNEIGDLLTVLQKGANAGAMPAWRERLLPNELVLVASYVASLRGTTPASPKGPDGREIPAWPDAPPADESIQESPAAEES